MKPTWIVTCDCGSYNSNAMFRGTAIESAKMHALMGPSHHLTVSDNTTKISIRQSSAGGYIMEQE